MEEFGLGWFAFFNTYIDIFLHWCVQTEYLALADQLSDYVVKLLDKVRGHDELEKLINKKRRDPRDESYDLLARLQMAIQCNEKKVSGWISLNLLELHKNPSTILKIRWKIMHLSQYHLKAFLSGCFYSGYNDMMKFFLPSYFLVCGSSELPAKAR